jgi:2-dehydro-3-deoxyphosphogluconate aldolase / (4S)-4-hydroxy-2-oxoglutarate aldolase
MTHFLRLEVLNRIIATGVIPVFYHPDPEVAQKLVSACAAGGALAVEFTNRGDNAYRVFSDLALHFAKTDPNIILGAGSVIDAPTGALFINSGAGFIVGPNFNAELARMCNRHKVAYIPGCGSVSEISDAEELGAEIVKVFPGDSVGGPQFIKSIHGPLPWSRLMPTGGVEATQASVAAWIKGGAVALGIGSNLFRKDWIEAENYAEITSLTAQMISWVREARRNG